MVKITTTRTRDRWHQGNDLPNNGLISHDRERHREVFVRLDPKRMVYGGAFAEAGYYRVAVDKAIVPELCTVLLWCHEQFDNRYAFIGGLFWFITQEDALLFRLAWGDR